MHKDNFKTRDMIFVILDQKCGICYTNIGDQVDYDYIEKFHIFDYLHADLPIQYTLGDYYISIDKFIITDQFYYIIIISSKEQNCECCSELLVDAVTGLYNRNYLEKIRETFCYSKCKNFSLILIDIDNLKKINDNYGHLKGDEAIEIVGKSIKKSIRAGDIGIRYGGDEFVIILFNEDDNVANKIVYRIRKEISRRSIIKNINIGISAGIAKADNLSDLDYIIRIADKNLYKEKKVKKKYNKIETNNLEDLRKDIERIRYKLNKEIFKSGGNLHNQEALKLSRELDEVIAKYSKNI